MKKLQILFYLFLAFAVVVSCTDDDDDDDDVFSPKTVEENKAHLESDGLEMLDEMKAMENTEAVETGASMSYFMDESDPLAGNPNFQDEEYKGTIPFIKPVVAVSQIPELGTKPVMLSLKSVTEEPESFQQLYDWLIGVYSWNASTEEWDYTATGDVVKFEFPSTDDGTTNDASLTISEYEGYTGTIGYDLEDYNGDLPEHIKVELAVDGTAVLTYEFTVVYNSNGEPTSFNTSLTFDGFEFSISLSNENNTKADFSAQIKHDADIMIRVAFGMEGDWSSTNVNDNVESDPDEQDVLDKATAEFQLMNTKIVGEVKVKELTTAMNTIYADEDTNPDFDYDAATEAEIVAINENVDLTVRYADNNEIIAEAEAYGYTNTYTDYIWDEATQNYIEVTVEETDIDLQFKFGDGTTVDAETYFDTGFDDLIEEFEAWIESLEDEWGV